LYENIKINVTRVRDDIEISEEIAPFETVYVADGNLAIDTQQVVNAGAEGVTRTRYRVRYENGNEVTRVLEDTWVAQEPAERVIAYGQQITPQTVTVGGQQITYWRHIRMLATSYSASTAGTSPTASNYGRTYTGDTMRHGIVAVDPAIVPLRSQVYVSDYGYGDALDTGGAIRARRIDLGYDDSNLVLWNRWVDVYLLWPPPAASEITWVLPNWPRPPQ
jgi:3D (Asp-Asp-Asp) domain-containing protein